jgi:hypothetical protein
MTMISIISGFGATAMFWWASSIPEIGLKSTIVGSCALILAIVSLVTGTGFGIDESCIRYSSRVDDC